MTEEIENIKTIIKNSPPDARMKGIKSIVFGVILVLLSASMMPIVPPPGTYGGFEGLGRIILGVIFFYGVYIIIFGLDSLATGKFNRVTTPVEFSADNTKGKAPLKVQFTDNTNFETIKKIWTFGDGETSVENNPIHTYAKSGKYSVSLELFTDNNSCNKTEKEFINVE